MNRQASGCHGCGRTFLSLSGLYTHYLFLCDRLLERSVKKEEGQQILLTSSLDFQDQFREGEDFEDTFLRYGILSNYPKRAKTEERK